MQSPQMILQVKDFAAHVTQCKSSLFGPYTILQRDVDWLDCELDVADGLLKHREFGQISFYEPTKKKCTFYQDAYLEATFFNS